MGSIFTVWRHARRGLIASVGCALAGSAVAQEGACGILFGPGDGNDTGGNPSAFAFGDFNHDDKLDMAVVGRGGANVAVMFGNGDGSFQPRTLYTVGDRPVAIAAEDFNGDDNLDLVTANRTANTISVLLGRADGTFENALEFDVGTTPVSVVTGDFDSDGRRDVVVAEKGSSTLRVMFGAGDGTFESVNVIQCPDSPWQMIGSDLDGNGTVDLILGTNYTNVLVYLGHSNGTFTGPAYYETTAQQNALAVADVTGDDIPDILAAIPTGVVLLRGLGGGEFQAPATSVGVPGFPVIAADFDGDGRADLATIINGANRHVSLRSGNGNGTFQSEVTVAIDAVSFIVVTADVNDDGRPDLVVGYDTQNYVSVYLNASTFPPQILQQPEPARTHMGPASFNVVADADAIGYLWRRDGVALADGERFSGVHTPNLEISTTEFGDAGDYTVDVAGPCNSRRSDPATLQVFCPSDFDENVFVNGDDFDSFSDLFYANDPGADFDGDGDVDQDDFDAFLAGFVPGC